MEYMSVKQTAQKLSVSTKTVYRMVDRKELNHRRVGRLIRIPESELNPTTRVISLERT
jgi:excisionase family DNA binding protein